MYVRATGVRRQRDEQSGAVPKEGDVGQVWRLGGPPAAGGEGDPGEMENKRQRQDGKGKVHTQVGHGGGDAGKGIRSRDMNRGAAGTQTARLDGGAVRDG